MKIIEKLQTAKQRKKTTQIRFNKALGFLISIEEAR
jgi:hypothetical protein